MHTPVRTASVLLSLVLALAMFATACGSDAEIVGDPAVSAEDASAVFGAEATDLIALVEAGGAQRIVSLSPTATEMLFAIGAGDQVHAADEFSNFPADAPTTPGLSGYQPNIESIAALEPDLVIGQSPIEGLAALGIAEYVQPAAASFDDIYNQMDEIGVLTGHRQTANEAASVLEAEIAAAQASLPETAEPLTYFHELGTELYSATSGTFIGEVYSLMGMVNIADAYDPDGFLYPQMTEEAIFAEDPDFIFLADTKCCEQSPDTVAARPGWDTLSAVQNGNVVALDDDVASRWGPRIIDFVEAIADGVNAAAEKGTLVGAG